MIQVNKKEYIEKIDISRNIDIGSNCFPVKMSTNMGNTGIGEICTVDPCAVAFCEDIARQIMNKDIFRISQLINDFTGGYVNPVKLKAVAAVMNATWDVIGKSLGLPVFNLLGGRMNNTLPVCAITPKSVVNSLERSVDFIKTAARKGYRAIKCFPFLAEPLNAVDYVKALREAAGKNIDIMLGLDGLQDVTSLMDFFSKIEQYDIAYVEVPFLYAHVPVREYRRNNPLVPMASGGTLTSAESVRQLFMSGKASIFTPDQSNLGGISVAKDLCSMAEAYTMRVAPIAAGGIASLAATASYAAGCPHLLTLQAPFETLETLERLDPKGGLRIRDGQLTLDGFWGLGIVC